MICYDATQLEAVISVALPKPKRGRGRPTKLIDNPFYGFIGPTTNYGQYPHFAMDILEGIARLDWHDRPIDSGGSSKPLSVKRLVAILAELEVVSAAKVVDQYRVGLRQAQRYVKAIELAMLYLLRSCPNGLSHEMRHGFPKASRVHEWEDQCEPPTPKALAKLHHDLRTLTAETV